MVCKNSYKNFSLNRVGQSLAIRGAAHHLSGSSHHGADVLGVGCLEYPTVGGPGKAAAGARAHDIHDVDNQFGFTLAQSVGHGAGIRPTGFIAVLEYLQNVGRLHPVKH